MPSKRIFTRRQLDARAKKITQTMIVRNRFSKTALGYAYTAAEYRAMVKDACIMTDETINEFHMIDVRGRIKRQVAPTVDNEGLGMELGPINDEEHNQMKEHE